MDADVEGPENMIGVGDDVIISGKVIEVTVYEQPYLCIYGVELKSGDKVYVKATDIKSYHPYQPIPESDERKGN